MLPDLGCGFFWENPNPDFWDLQSEHFFWENNLKKSIFDKQFSEQKSMTF